MATWDGRPDVKGRRQGKSKGKGVARGNRHEVFSFALERSKEFLVQNLSPLTKTFLTDLQSKDILTRKEIQNITEKTKEENDQIRVLVNVLKKKSSRKQEILDALNREKPFVAKHVEYQIQKTENENVYGEVFALIAQEIQDDLKNLATQLKFSDDQCNIIEIYKAVDEMLYVWLSVVQRHTGRYNFLKILINVLENLQRKDVAEKVIQTLNIDTERLDNPSDDMWKDFVQELHEQPITSVVSTKETREQEPPSQNIYISSKGDVHCGDVNVTVYSTEDKGDEQYSKADIVSKSDDILRNYNKLHLDELRAEYKKRTPGKQPSEEDFLNTLERYPERFLVDEVEFEYYVALVSNTVFSTGRFVEENNLLSQGNTREAKGNRYTKDDTCSENVGEDTPEPVSKTFGEDKCSQFKNFFQSVQEFQNGNFVLLTHKAPSQYTHIGCLANIPWLCVFDFDECSRDDGLLLSVEDDITAQRRIYACTWQDPPNISPNSTEWCFLRGSKQIASSRFEKNITTKKWYDIIHKKFKLHVDCIAQYLDSLTSLTIIAIWPNDPSLANNYVRVINELQQINADGTKMYILGCPAESAIDSVDPDLVLSESLEYIYHDLAKYMSRRPKLKGRLKYELPSSIDPLNKTCVLEEENASLFRDNFEILYINEHFTDQDLDLTELEKEKSNFLKGGTLKWSSYYNYGPDHFCGERDIFKSIVSTIRKCYLDTYKTGIITIYHEPGSGGTTLAQRVLWELHDFAPCAQLKLNIQSTFSEVAQQVQILYEKTHLPVVLLLDGIDKTDMFLLQRLVGRAHVVYLHLERVSWKRESLQKDKEFILNGALTKWEALKIGSRFQQSCQTDEKKDQLQKLINRVTEGGTCHLIEFGLVTYLHEYKGVGAYVREYLRVEKGRKNTASQLILGYLSLVYYYSQMPMPCLSFRHLLKTKTDVGFDDLPDEVKELVVPSENEYRHISVRICHVLVAKEILEQILTGEASKHTTNKYLRHEGLSNTAKCNLKEFSVEFIKEMGKMKSHIQSSLMNDILARTFIYRDYVESGEGESRIKKKPKLAKIIDNIQDIDKKIEVFEKLVEFFPENARFVAHLARLLSICKPADEETPEKLYKKALEICEKHSSVPLERNVWQNDESQIFHMYGMLYASKLNKFISSHADGQITDELLNKPLDLAIQACRLFEKSAKAAIEGNTVHYGYQGEVYIRLEFCRLVKKKTSFANFVDLNEALKQNQNALQFVTGSIYRVRELMHLIHFSTEFYQIPSNYYKRVKLYHELFDGLPIPQGLDFTPAQNPVDKRRIAIAAIKNTYRKDTVAIEDISDESHIKEIIVYCEANFKAVQEDVSLSSPVSLDLDYIHWIRAIRSPYFTQSNDYPLPRVLSIVNQWYATLDTPAARFYRFVMYSIIGFGFGFGSSSDISFLDEACEMQKKVTKDSKFKSKPLRELLGTGNGIKRLKNHANPRDISMETVVEEGNFAILVGTIQSPNNLVQSGYITIDLGENLRNVNAFYVPIKTKENLRGTAYAGKRVEFILAFTSISGYEAYCVQLLKKFECSQCSLKCEMKSDEMMKKCKRCGQTVHKN